MTAPLLRIAVASALLTTAPAALEAQVAAQTQPVSVTITVPFTLQRMHPELLRIQLSCMLYVDGTPASMGSIKSLQIAVATLTRTPDGSVSGEAIARGTINVPTSAAGRSGTYRCLPYGSVGMTMIQLTPSSSDPRLRTQGTAPLNASGALQW